MEVENLIESFSEFKEVKNIDRETMMNILEDVFKSVLAKKYDEADKERLSNALGGLATKFIDAGLDYFTKNTGGYSADWMTVGNTNDITGGGIDYEFGGDFDF